MNEIIQFGSLELRFLQSGQDTDAGLDLFEMLLRPGGRMPVPHYHESWDETVYGLGGTSTWRIAGRDVDLAPGESIFIPRGVVHGFENRSGAEARCLCILDSGRTWSRLFPGDGCADLKGIAGPGSHARGHDPPWADPRASALGENPPQMWIARFSTAIAASFTASRQRRMGVAGAGEVLGRAAEFHQHGGFVDQLAGAGADDVDAEHAVGRWRRPASSRSRRWWRMARARPLAVKGNLPTL